MHSPNGPAIVPASGVVQPIVDQPLVVDQSALLEPVPSCERLVEIILGSISRPSSQMSGRIDVEFVGDRVDVSVRFVPPQAATGRSVVRLVHVVENDLRGIKVLVISGHIVGSDPVDSINVRGSFRLRSLDGPERLLLEGFTYQAKTHHPSSS
jgi:uncharacterized protein (DUF2342 family)